VLEQTSHILPDDYQISSHNNGELSLSYAIYYLGLIFTKVHADASDFASDVTKEDAYKQVLQQAEALFHEQRNWVSSSISTMLKSHANDPSGLVRKTNHVNFVLLKTL
jgi:putative methionine-R-sulfoxide reductase with GAF domain